MAMRSWGQREKRQNRHTQPLRTAGYAAVCSVRIVVVNGMGAAKAAIQI